MVVGTETDDCLLSLALWQRIGIFSFFLSFFFKHVPEVLFRILFIMCRTGHAPHFCPSLLCFCVTSPVQQPLMGCVTTSDSLLLSMSKNQLYFNLYFMCRDWPNYMYMCASAPPYLFFSSRKKEDWALPGVKSSSQRPTLPTHYQPHC